MKKPLIQIHKEFIIYLNSLPVKKRKSFIKSLKGCHIRCISEIFSNFLKKNLTQNKTVINKLRKFKKDIKKVALKRTALKDKVKTLISQRGGSILSLLLPLAVSVISSLFGKGKS